MKSLVLLRGRSTDQGTPGVLLRPDATLMAHTLELPWRDNRVRRSCIPPGYMPPGSYTCRMRRSPKFGQVYEVQNVPGRSAILIHPGNVAGDSEKGLATNVLGCILVGLYRGTLHGQMAVLSSRPAVTRLEQEMEGQPFRLEVVPWISGS